MSEPYRMTYAELIDYCNRRQSEVCNGCPYFRTACRDFMEATFTYPYRMEHSEFYTEKEIPKYE